MDLEQSLMARLADGRFHSGSDLAERFGISRTAIWKALERLRQQLGLEIHSVRGRGYRLATPLELFDPQQITSSLSCPPLFSGLTIHQSIDSTNQWLMQQRELQAGHVCLAERQTAGRGRRGRNWVSPFGQNIYLSILWNYPCSTAELGGLSLAAGVAVARVLEASGAEGIGLKWPNDLLWNGKKLAGLLLEVSGEQGGPSRVVLGLGLNLRLSTQQATSIDQPWTDLARVCGGSPPSRNHMASRLIDALLETLDGFGSRGLDPLVEAWSRYDLYRDQTVRLIMGNREIQGLHRGIDSSGALLLETDAGIKAFHGGEVTLRARS